MGDDALERDVGTGLPSDGNREPLAGIGVGKRDAGVLTNSVHVSKRGFDLVERDLQAAPIRDRFEATDDGQARVVQVDEVTGAEPAIFERVGLVIRVDVAQEHARARSMPSRA